MKSNEIQHNHGGDKDEEVELDNKKVIKEEEKTMGIKTRKIKANKWK